MRRELPVYYFKKVKKVRNTLKLKQLRTIYTACGAIAAV